MRYFEDYQIGETSITRKRTITEADIIQFCMFTGDWHPLHSDLEYAKQTSFGQRIAHGLLVLSVASGLMTIAEDMAFIAFYGMDKVRFYKPVFIHDTLHVEVQITEKEKKDKGGVITMENRIKNHENEDVAVAIQKALVAYAPVKT